MNPARRQILRVGGGILASLASPLASGRAEDVVEIHMQGNPDGSKVWFDPVGIFVQQGQTIRWINQNAGNSHTTTAYHPEILNRPRRIPAQAKPWNSDYLLPDETFSIKL